MFRKTIINLFIVLAILLTGVGTASAGPPAQNELTYTVKPGDNLWTLAEKYLGNGRDYVAIVLATNAKHAEDSSFALIQNPGLIRPGWKLLIPSATAAPAAPAAATGTCGRVEDEINVGQFAPCETVNTTDIVAILNPYEVLPYTAINKLDRLFEANTNYGYQYRQVIPARIAVAKPAQRLMWGSLDWIRELSASDQTKVESRILRLRCDGNNPCIYLLVDGDEVSVGWSGRGLLLSRPLNPEVDFADWWGKPDP